jgi:hypothetical protein
VPRIVPEPLASIHRQPSVDQDAPGERAAESARASAYLDSLAHTRNDPYDPRGPFSFYRDLWILEASRSRRQGTLQEPRFELHDPGAEPGEDPWGPYNTPADAERRVSRALRDLSSSTGSVPDLLRPSAPGRLSEIFGAAASRVSGLADVFQREPLEPGMVDTSGSQLLVKIPRLATGSSVTAIAENAAVFETDPTSTSYSAAVGMETEESGLDA